MSGGYAYLTNSIGKAIDSVKKVSVNDEINLYLKDGKVSAIVNDIEIK